jgi:hypothetical protein
MSDLTTYQQFEKPLDHEQLLEHLIQQRLEELGAVFGNSYIEGLKLEWMSSSSIKVKTGAADIPDRSRRLRVTSDITVSSISLGNNTWGYVYLYNNAGVTAVEVVTTAPVSYFGSAYQKTGDATRRYLGSVRTNGSGNIFSFLHQGDRIFYREQIAASPFRVLNGGTATSETAVSCTAVIPVTSRIALLHMVNTATNTNVSIGTSDDNTSSLIRDLYVVQDVVGDTPLDSSQALTYKFATAPSGAGALYVDVVGYKFER